MRTWWVRSPSSWSSESTDELTMGHIDHQSVQAAKGAERNAFEKCYVKICFSGVTYASLI